MSIWGRLQRAVARLIDWYNPLTWRHRGWLWLTGLVVGTYAVIVIILGILWSDEPEAFDVRAVAEARLGDAAPARLPPGYVTTSAVLGVAETLLEKSGGYLTNDKSLPGLYLDNVPSWEFGVLTAVRDSTRALRNDFARAQSQSREDQDLVIAQPQFNYDSDSWILPSTESEYRKGIEALDRYLVRLADGNPQDGQFYTRADNLRLYLGEVDKRLGDLAQRLAASVGQARVNLALAGDRNAEESKPSPELSYEQTPWLEIDNTYYEARGYTWALLHTLRGIEVDFAPVLEDKNALVSLRQIIRELEGAQQNLWSPMVLNGTGFGVLANHSLVMASYISRANAAVIDLRDLLGQG